MRSPISKLNNAATAGRSPPTQPLSDCWNAVIPLATNQAAGKPARPAPSVAHQFLRSHPMPPHFRARSGASLRRQRHHPGLRQHARSGPARRALGLSTLLAGRAPQHAGHRQRRHRRTDRPCRRRHQDHPCGRRRHHVAQPHPAACGRTIRHAGFAVSAAHRPGLGPCTRHRPAHRTRLAPRFSTAPTTSRRTWPT